MMKCNTCGQEFDPGNLTSVMSHEHNENINPAIAIGIKGEKKPKTLLEIQNEVAIENGFEDWVLVMDSMRDPQLWPEVCRRAQLECARETLKEASKKARTWAKSCKSCHQQGKLSCACHEPRVKIDKSSITDEANIKLIQ